jgi:DNA polymerase-1
MSSDYSQIELRVLAHFSQDETMMRMFAEEIDFHKQTAAEMYEVPLEELPRKCGELPKPLTLESSMASVLGVS